MKKGMLVIIIFILLGMTVPGKEIRSEEVYQTIPDEAIRLRILANSDTEEDQHIKRLVRDQVNAYIAELVQYIDNIQEARETIQEQLPAIRDIVENTLESAGKTDGFQVDYRPDVTFPTKIYDRYIYPAGEYEAVLISIGKGKGSNWWCVLFPPLCFLDFSNGAMVEEDEDIEVDSEIIEEPIEKELEAEMEEEDLDEAEEEVEVSFSFFLFEWLGLS